MFTISFHLNGNKKILATIDKYDSFDPDRELICGCSEEYYDNAVDAMFGTFDFFVKSFPEESDGLTDFICNKGYKIAHAITVDE